MVNIYNNNGYLETYFLIDYNITCDTAKELLNNKKRIWIKI